MSLERWGIKEWPLENNGTMRHSRRPNANFNSTAKSSMERGVVLKILFNFMFVCSYIRVHRGLCAVYEVFQWVFFSVVGNEFVERHTRDCSRRVVIQLFCICKCLLMLRIYFPECWNRRVLSTQHSNFNSGVFFRFFPIFKYASITIEFHENFRLTYDPIRKSRWIDNNFFQ